jgi:TPR repeat protein
MRITHPLTFFTAALLLGACQSLLLDDLPEKAGPPVSTTVATGNDIDPRSTTDTKPKSVRIRARGATTTKDIPTPQKEAKATPQQNTTAKPEKDALSEIGEFFNLLFATQTSENTAAKIKNPQSAPGLNADSVPASKDKPISIAKATLPASESTANTTTAPRNNLPPKRIERRYSAAYGVYHPLAEKGHAFAQYEMGLMYLHGYGVANDAGRAEQWFRKAALRGHPDAKTELRKLIAGSKPATPKTAKTDSQVATILTTPAADLAGDKISAPSENAPATPTAAPDPATSTLSKPAPADVKLSPPNLAKSATPTIAEEEEPPTVFISSKAVTTEPPQPEQDSDNVIDGLLPRLEITDFKKDPDQADLTKETGQALSRLFGDAEKAPPTNNVNDPKDDVQPATPLKATTTPVQTVDTAAAKQRGDSEGTPATPKPLVLRKPTPPLQARAPKEKNAPPASTASSDSSQVGVGSAVLLEPKPSTAKPAPTEPDSVTATTKTTTADLSPAEKPEIPKATVETDSHASFNKGLVAYNNSDFKQAIQHWQPLAEKGEPESQTRLGYLYEHGKGVPKNYQDAVNWYQKAASQGEPAAQFNLGVMYRKGRGVPKDDKVARQWYEKAASQGHPIAERVIEVMKAYKIGE